MANQLTRQERMVLRAYKQDVAKARRSGKRAGKAEAQRKAAAWAKQKRRRALAAWLIASGICLLLAAWALLVKIEPGLKGLLLWCAVLAFGFCEVKFFRTWLRS